MVRLLIFTFVLFLLGIGIAEGFTGTYGINYGRIADNIPEPETVVRLLRAAKIKNVKIFDFNHSVIQAFKGSGLNLVIAIPNENLKEMNASEDRAVSWLKENVQPFVPGTRITGIAVGNEVLGSSDQELEDSLVGAVKNVYHALGRLHLSDSIQVWTPHSQAVFQNSYPPSSCTFSENIVQYMKPLLEFFSKVGTPFFINIYPFIAYKGDSGHIDINYALFQPNSGIYDEKAGLHYDNMFDATVDAAYSALEDAGFGDMEVVVSETGWASSGDEDEAGATAQNARMYNYNLHKRLARRRGTPRTPKVVMKTYVFALFNEDLKPGPGSERHYGLYKPDGTIAYDIGFPSLKSGHASISLLSLKNIHGQGGLVPYTMVLVTCITVMLLVLMR